MVDPGELSREDLLALVSAQAAQIATANAEIATLQVTNAGLAARVERLERLISRNSGNSSMPPSKDGEPGRTAPSKPTRRPKVAGEARDKGKQVGAPGANLAWNDDPDARVDRFPEGRCECGADLGAGADLGVTESYQQIEIPLVSATTTQYELHTVGCGCGKVHTAPRPPGAGGDPGRVGYGPNLRAWCVYLMVAHALPVHRVAGMLETLTGAAPSVGFVHGTLKVAAAAMAAIAERIRTLINAADVVACDETPIKVGPAKPAEGKKKADKYLFVAATGAYTWYMLGDRDLPSFKKFALTEMSGVIVHDRYFLYDHPEVGNLTHQLCCAHLIRDCEDAAEVYPDAAWPTQIQDALRELIHHANTAREAGATAIPAHLTEAPLRAFRHGVRIGLSEIPRTATPASGRAPKQPHGRPLLECLRDREADVLRFVTDLRIPPTSNDAERGVRPAKTQQNSSGRLTSEQRTRDRYTIRGVLSTAAKHGQDQLAVIRDAFTGRPWMPPLPAPG